VFRYLHPNTVRETLVQALLQSPIFETRWRWSTRFRSPCRATAAARASQPAPAHVRRGPAAGGVPDAVACQDNLQGAREIPDHPLVTRRCAMRWRRRSTSHGLETKLQRLCAGEIRTVARDTPEPSVLSHELLNSAVYTFLDDAPLEERRTRAVYTRRATEARSADDPGRARSRCIERVRARPGRSQIPRTRCTTRSWSPASSDRGVAPHWPALLHELGERALKRGDAWLAYERKDDDPVEILQPPGGPRARNGAAN
jgi:ATP-dependent Lhr-like helicase